MAVNTSDAMFDALRTQGYAGALPDMRRHYLDSGGYATIGELYAANGFTSGHISDFANAYWNGTPEVIPPV